jgi:hypothetical protein
MFYLYRSGSSYSELDINLVEAERGQHAQPRRQERIKAATRTTPLLLRCLEDAAGVRQGSGGTMDVWGGDQADTGSCSSSWSTRPAFTGAAATQRSTAATRAAWELLETGVDGVVGSWACRRAKGDGGGGGISETAGYSVSLSFVGLGFGPAVSVRFKGSGCVAVRCTMSTRERSTSLCSICHNVRGSRSIIGILVEKVFQLFPDGQTATLHTSK